MMLTLILIGSLSFDIDANKPIKVVLPWRTDDRYYNSPVGYASAPKSNASVVKKVIVEPLGSTSLNGWSIEVNGRDLLSQNGWQQFFNKGNNSSLIEVYNRWRDLACHGLGGGPESSDPWGIVDLWGKSLCMDDAWGFAKIAKKAGFPSHRLEMNQHVVNEYFWNGAWRVLDTDQEVFFLKLDGVTPASYEDIKKDPLLILRTKPFGRSVNWNPTAAWWNLSLYDFSSDSWFLHPSKTAALLNREPYSLLEGERCEFEYDEPAPPVNNSNPIPGEKNQRVKLYYDIKKRELLNIGMGAPYPVEIDPQGRFSFHANEPSTSQDTSLKKIACFGSLVSFPEFHAGENGVILRTLNGVGSCRVTISYSKDAADQVPPTPPEMSIISLNKGVPVIGIKAAKQEKLWWQISPDPTFEMVPPNFDKIEEGPMWQLEMTNPVDQTFFVPQLRYYCRSKYLSAGLWSVWSLPVSFTVEKPVAPQGVFVESFTVGEKAVVRWKPSKGMMCIYGSDRVDFLPEPYFGKQAVSGILRGGGLSIVWTNDANQLALIPAQWGMARVPISNFYRLIKMEDNVLSIPSSLVYLPSVLKTSSQPPCIFSRNKHRGNEGDIVAKPVEFR